jgi:5'-nucleotidase
MPPSIPPSAERPRVLVTNDDGIDSKGLWHLAAAASDAGLDVVIAAPASEASGSGSALKAVDDGGRVEFQRRELPAPAAAITAYALRATPAFIVFAAARGAFGFRPQYVLSGINRGPNRGRDVLHSGTVAAAMTAAGYGITAAAFSLDAEADDDQPAWLTAGLVAGQVIPVLPDVPAGTVLNVNVPNVRPECFPGIRRASLAEFGAVETSLDPATEGYLQLGTPGSTDPPEPGTDSAVLSSGYASITPLHAICELPSVVLPWSTAPDADPQTVRSSQPG